MPENIIRMDMGINTEHKKSDKSVLCLGVESSCDETSAAIVDSDKNILAHIIYSQIPEHQKYGGVVPELAARAHILAVDEVIRLTLERAGKTIDDIDVIAATAGPGLIGGVLVGWMAATGIANAKNKPLVAVNHLEGHALVPRLCAASASDSTTNIDIKFPYLLMLASGGHCQILLVHNVGKYELIGQTLDDSAGEAFDKVAKMLGLGYPGGPKVEKAAHNGNPKAYVFPRAKIDEHPYDFSFSGVKSAVLNTINAANMKGETVNPDDIAAAFQESVIDSMRERVLMAIDEFGMKKFAMAGGVASNQTIRHALQEACEGVGAEFFCPPPILCTDNAAMIASAGFYRFQKGERAGWDLNAVPNLKLGER